VIQTLARYAAQPLRFWRYGGGTVIITIVLVPSGQPFSRHTQQLARLSGRLVICSRFDALASSRALLSQTNLRPSVAGGFKRRDPNRIRVETIVRGRYRDNRDAETKRVRARRKSTLAAAMVGGAIALAAGCMTSQEIDQTLPPYASISDEARDPASVPTPAPSASSSGDSGGLMSAIGTTIMYPFHLVGEAFGSSSNSN